MAISFRSMFREPSNRAELQMLNPNETSLICELCHLLREGNVKENTELLVGLILTHLIPGNIKK